MYISAQDLKEVLSERSLIELSQDTSRATEANLEVLDKACGYATEVVDGYLRSRYLLPLETVPTIVKNISLQLARYWLYSRRPESKGFPDNVKETYNQALKDLERIQNGKLHLGVTPLNEKGSDVLLGTAKFQTRASEKLDLSGY